MNRPTHLILISALIAVCLCVPVSPVGAQGTLDLVGRWPYGPAKGVSTSGNYAYVGSGCVLQVVDSSNPVQLQVVGEVNLPDVVENVAISGGYAYVADGEAGLRVIDVSTPAEPVEVGSLDTPGQAGDVAVSGGYAYVAGGESGLRIVDVGVPSAPIEVAALDPVYHSLRNVGVSGDYVLLVEEQPGAPINMWAFALRVVDISTPSAPIEVSLTSGDDLTGSGGWCNMPTGFTVAGHYAYITVNCLNGGGGLWVIDISDPPSPIALGSAYPPFYTGPVSVSGSYAYVVGSRAPEGALAAIDVSDALNPAVVGVLDGLPDPRFGGVAVMGAQAYVANDWNGLRVIDVSTPAEPVEVGFVDAPGAATDVAISGGIAYLTTEGDLRVLDVHEPATPIHLGTVEVPGVARVAVNGGHAYLAYHFHGGGGDLYGFLIIDVSDPAAPTQVGLLGDDIGQVNGVAVSGSYAYVATSSSGAGLAVIDVSNPSTPFVAGTGLNGTDCEGVAVSDGYVYMACDGGLGIVDVSAPSAPSMVGWVYAGVDNYAVALAGNFAYMTGQRTFRVIDISDPIDPVQVGHVTFTNPARQDVVLFGDYAYLSDPREGLVRTIDVSNPTNPIEVGGTDTPGGLGGLAMSEGHLFVADGPAGMEIFEPVAVFTDSFESGDTSAWSATVP